MILIYDEARNPNIFYRCGFDSDVPCLYVEDEKKRLWVPGFEYPRAKEEAKNDVEVLPLTSLVDTLKELKGPFTVPNDIPHGIVKHLGEDITFEQTLFPERLAKTEEEIAAINDCQKMASAVMNLIQKKIDESTLTEGVLHWNDEPLTSEYLKAEARSLLLHRGYDCPDIIVASGSQTKQPHNRGSGPIQEGSLIVDVFPKSEKTKYSGDMTRTFIIGEAPEEEKMLAAAKEVHDIVISLCVPGTQASALHETAVEEFEKRGYSTDDDTGLIHAIGHGVGLAVHEGPTLVPSNDKELAENMVLAIEPGVYYDTGVRYENIVVVKDTPVVLGKDL